MNEDCNVCIGYSGDYDGSSLYSSLNAVARKPHTCCECQKIIAPRERYERAKGKIDGGWFTAHTCLVCAEIRDAFCCEGFAHGFLWDDVRDRLLPVMTTGCLGRLTTAAAKQRLMDEWRRKKLK